MFGTSLRTYERERPNSTDFICESCGAAAKIRKNGVINLARCVVQEVPRFFCPTCYRRWSKAPQTMAFKRDAKADVQRARFIAVQENDLLMAQVDKLTDKLAKDVQRIFLDQELRPLLLEVEDIKTTFMSIARRHNSGICAKIAEAADTVLDRMKATPDALRTYNHELKGDVRESDERVEDLSETVRIQTLDGSVDEVRRTLPDAPLDDAETDEDIDSMLEMYEKGIWRP